MLAFAYAGRLVKEITENAYFSTATTQGDAEHVPRFTLSTHQNALRTGLFLLANTTGMACHRRKQSFLPIPVLQKFCLAIFQRRHGSHPFAERNESSAFSAEQIDANLQRSHDHSLLAVGF